LTKHPAFFAERRPPLISHCDLNPKEMTSIADGRQAYGNGLVFRLRDR
jgi:hypothetical protein